jgi:hypothetical protein
VQESFALLFIGTVVSIGVGVAGWALIKLIGLEAKLSGFTQWMVQHEKTDEKEFTSLDERLDVMDRELKEIKERVFTLQEGIHARQSQILDAIKVMGREMRDEFKKEKI